MRQGLATLDTRLPANPKVRLRTNGKHPLVVTPWRRNPSRSGSKPSRRRSVGAGR